MPQTLKMPRRQEEDTTGACAPWPARRHYPRYARNQNAREYHNEGSVSNHIINRTCDCAQELDAAFDPPEFDIATRYAQVMNTVFSVLFFCSGMPILLLVAWLDLSLLFATDKWMFTHIYKKPPQYDGALAKLGAAVLPFAVPTSPFWN